MSPNTLAYCITALIGIAGLALAIFWGLSGFSSKLAERITNAKEDIVSELSGIKQKIVKIDTQVTNVLYLVNSYIGGQLATTVINLKNFGNTRISAQPGFTETTYVIRADKGILNVDLMAKASITTGLNEVETKMFGQLVQMFSMGVNALRLVIPSTDPQKCTEYINKFLAWLDKEYQIELAQVAEFESGIKSPDSD